MSTNKATVNLFLIRLIRTAITIITLTFSVKYFGVDMDRDIWVLTATLIATITQAVWGPLNEIFRTKFVFIREECGESVAIRRTGSLVGFIFWTTLAICIILFLLASPLSSIMTKNMQGNAASLFVILLLLQLPSLLLSELSNIGISILNAYEVYYIPEIVGFFGGIANLASIILLAPTWGIYSLLVGTYFGIFTLFAAVAYYLRKKDLKVWQYLFDVKWADVQLYLVFSLPFFFPYFIGQFNAIFERVIAGYLGDGNIASVEYARQFITVLQTVLSSVLTTIMVPLLAKYFVQNKRGLFNQTILDNINTSTLIYCVFAVFLVSGASPLCDFFFNRGKINLASLLTITNLTQYYGIAFFFVFNYIILGMGLLASDQGKYYATIGVLTQLLGFAINLIGCRYIGVYIFPLSLGIVHLVASALMFSHSKYLDKHLFVRRIAKSLTVASLFLFLFRLIGIYISCDSSFVQLVVIGVILLSTMPFLCKIFGVNLFNIIRKQ